MFDPFAELGPQSGTNRGENAGDIPAVEFVEGGAVSVVKAFEQHPGRRRVRHDLALRGRKKIEISKRSEIPRSVGVRIPLTILTDVNKQFNNVTRKGGKSC